MIETPVLCLHKHLEWVLRYLVLKLSPSCQWVHSVVFWAKSSYLWLDIFLWNEFCFSCMPIKFLVSKNLVVNKRLLKFYTVMHCLIMEIHSDNCAVRLFCHWVHIIVCTYKPKWHGLPHTEAIWYSLLLHSCIRGLSVTTKLCSAGLYLGTYGNSSTCNLPIIGQKSNMDC